MRVKKFSADANKSYNAASCSVTEEQEGTDVEEEAYTCSSHILSVLRMRGSNFKYRNCVFAKKKKSVTLYVADFMKSLITDWISCCQVSCNWVTNIITFFIVQKCHNQVNNMNKWERTTCNYLVYIKPELMLVTTELFIWTSHCSVSLFCYSSTVYRCLTQ